MSSESFSHETSSPTQELENSPESLEILRERLSAMAERVNAELEKEGMKPLLGKHGRIMMSAYKGEFQYPAHTVKDDSLRVDVMENGFASQVEKQDRERYYYEYGADSEEEVAQSWRKERATSLAEQWEMYVSVLFNELFGEDFFVLRTSTFDDYVSGVDTLIIHKETGEVVCAVDEVSLGKNSKGKQRKQEKVCRANEEGGKKVKYGVVKKDGHFVMGENKHVPVLYADITVEDLQRMLLLSSMTTPERGVHPEEIVLCKRLLDDMEVQTSEMERAIITKEHERQNEPWRRIPEQVPLEGSPVKRNIWAAQRRFADMQRCLEKYHAE
ncbi:MAG: hypothetical protein H8D63_03275 [Parcubacteria group bacterium]|nr:hypothetical protein [Parcubacteria group bacterium]